MRTFFALLALLVFPLAGCAERAETGDAATVGGDVAPAASSATPAAPATAAAPGRVFERDQLGGKPCKLVTPQQLAAIAGVDASRVPESPALQAP